jgi:hypothetical protein
MSELYQFLQYHTKFQNKKIVQHASCKFPTKLDMMDKIHVLCLITVHSEYVNRTNVSLLSLTRKV